MCKIVLVFFRHNTAYEMRISDWSSDVCSADLASGGRSLHAWESVQPLRSVPLRLRLVVPQAGARRQAGHAVASRCLWRTAVGAPSGARGSGAGRAGLAGNAADRLMAPWRRSEEQTSELQSLMRISYAVFCLKKKKKHQQQQQRHYNN